jgi:hypothetical protein
MSAVLHAIIFGPSSAAPHLSAKTTHAQIDRHAVEQARRVQELRERPRPGRNPEPLSRGTGGTARTRRSIAHLNVRSSNARSSSTAMRTLSRYWKQSSVTAQPTRKSCEPSHVHMPIEIMANGPRRSECRGRPSPRTTGRSESTPVGTAAACRRCCASPSHPTRLSPARAAEGSGRELESKTGFASTIRTGLTLSRWHPGHPP